MNPRVLAGVGVLSAAAVVSGIDVAVEASAANSAEYVYDSHVVFDGGVKLYTLDDGGVTDAAPCSRRQPSDLLCLRNGSLPPPLNRFPRKESNGLCEDVACAVMAGEDADAPEVARGGKP